MQHEPIALVSFLTVFHSHNSSHPAQKHLKKKKNMLISSGKSSIVSDTDNINYQGQLFHTNNNLEACCIIFLMCFLSISKPSQALQSTAIWGQCWPPRSQSRQMGCIHRSGGRGNADKKKNNKTDQTAKGRKDTRA